MVVPNKFLAHVVIRPNDGSSPPYTVETEFTAAGYPQAFEHIQGLSRTFDGAIVSHRLQMLDGKVQSEYERVRFRPPDDSDTRPPLALPAPEKTKEGPALTVNGRPEWLGVFTPPKVKIKGFPSNSMEVCTK